MAIYEPVIAEEESIMADPYLLTFDLNISSNYSIGITPKEIKETYSGISYIYQKIVVSDIEGNGWEPDLKIEISNFTETDFTLDDLKSGYKSNESTMVNTEIYNQTIDNKEGLLFVSTILGLNIFQLAYFCDDSTLIWVDCRLPWDEGTLNLLKTIHIEKLK
jgi:hypothetical protein